MVFVAVRQHERGGAPFLLQVRQIRNDQIDAQQFRIREHDAGVDDDRRVAPGERQHVHAELAESAERDNVEHQFKGVQTCATSVPGRTVSTKGAAMRLDQAAGRA